MSKKKKTLRVIVSLLLIFSVAGFVLFKILVSPGRIKNAIETAASSALQMEVSVGEVSLHPGLLTLQEVKVLPENQKENRESLFSADRIKLGFEIMPLFRKKFVFKSITVYQPRVSLKTIPAVNVKKLLEYAGTPSSGSRMEFPLSRLKIFNGNLILQKPKISLYALDLTLKDSSLNHPFLINASAKVRNSYFERVSLESEIDLLRNYADIKNITVSGYGARAEGSGRVNNLIVSPHADIDYRLVKFPSEFLGEKIKFQGQPEVKGNLTYKAGSLYLEWNSKFSAVDITIENFVRKTAGRRLRFRGGASYTEGLPSINWYIFEAGPDTFSGTGLIDKSGAVKLNIRADNVNLKNIGKFLLPVGKYASSGYADLKGDAIFARGKSSIEAKLSMRELRIKDVPGLSDLYERFKRTRRSEFLFESVQADIFIDREKLILNSLSAEGPQLRGSGSGRLVWEENVDFTFYPVIGGSRIGIRLSGSPDRTRISLK